MTTSKVWQYIHTRWMIWNIGPTWSRSNMGNGKVYYEEWHFMQLCNTAYMLTWTSCIDVLFACCKHLEWHLPWNKTRRRCIPSNASYVTRNSNPTRGGLSTPSRSRVAPTQADRCKRGGPAVLAAKFSTMLLDSLDTLKSVPRCASTVATHLEPVPIQPGFGSKVVAQEETANALQIWTRSEAETLEPGDTWVTTPQAQQLLHLCRTEGWFSEEEATTAIMDYLKVAPVSYGELTTIREKLGEEELENQHALQEALDGIVAQARAPVDAPHQEEVDIDGSLFLRHELKLPDKVERSPTVFRYILHVFSGVRRDGDLHSALLAVTPPDGMTLFPISIDIVLSDRYCDLLDPKQQKRWLTWAQEGAIYMMIGGPPCETWSVSRLRWLESHEGPRPVRNGNRLEDHIWGLPQLRIKEARQVRVANSLLHFCIFIFLAQVLTQAIAIIEHPDRAGPRGAIIDGYSRWCNTSNQQVQFFPCTSSKDSGTRNRPNPRCCWQQFQLPVGGQFWNAWRASKFEVPFLLLYVWDAMNATSTGQLHSRDIQRLYARRSRVWRWSSSKQYHTLQAAMTTYFRWRRCYERFT